LRRYIFDVNKNKINNQTNIVIASTIETQYTRFSCHLDVSMHWTQYCCCCFLVLCCLVQWAGGAINAWNSSTNLSNVVFRNNNAKGVSNILFWHNKDSSLDILFSTIVCCDVEQIDRMNRTVVLLSLAVNLLPILLSLYKIPSFSMTLHPWYVDGM
jgi:hypothetical protein